MLSASAFAPQRSARAVGSDRVRPDASIRHLHPPPRSARRIKPSSPPLRAGLAPPRYACPDGPGRCGERTARTRTRTHGGARAGGAPPGKVRPAGQPAPGMRMVPSLHGSSPGQSPASGRWPETGQARATGGPRGRACRPARARPSGLVCAARRGRRLRRSGGRPRPGARCGWRV